MKRLIRSKYLDITLVKGLAVGVGYDDYDLAIMLGVFLIEIKLWKFRPKPFSRAKV